MPWDENTGARVCEQIAIGKSVLAACEISGCTESEFWGRVSKNEALKEDYVRAREAKAHVRAETVETYKQMLLDGRIDAQTFRGLLEAVKWQTSKEAPKSYGDRMEHVGIPAAQTNVVLPPLEQLRRIRQARGEPRGEP